MRKKVDGRETEKDTPTSTPHNHRTPPKPTGTAPTGGAGPHPAPPNTHQPGTSAKGGRPRHSEGHKGRAEGKPKAGSKKRLLPATSRGGIDGIASRDVRLSGLPLELIAA